MKAKPMSIEIMVDAEYAGRTLAYFSKGHHDKNEFATTLNLEYCVVPNLEDVKHEFYRKTPAKDCDDVDYRLVESRQGKGAFAVTIYYLG